MQKFFFIAILSLFIKSVAAQTADTLITKSYLDSLKSALLELKDQKNSLYWSNQRAKFVKATDTVFIRTDSAIASYYLSKGELLMQETIEFNSERKKVAYVERYYDNNQRVVYVEHWFTLNDNAFFDAKMEKKERMEYDNLGRLSLHVTYFSGMIGWTEKRQYLYDTDGVATVNITKYKGWVFWDKP